MGHSHVPDGKAFLAAFLGLEVCSENGWSAGEVGPVPLRVDLTPYFHKLALIPKILEAGDTALWQDNMDTHL